MTLDALQTGEKAKITKVEGEGSMQAPVRHGAYPRYKYYPV